jgi:hypothetical protein
MDHRWKHRRPWLPVPLVLCIAMTAVSVTLSAEIASLTGASCV